MPSPFDLATKALLKLYGYWRPPKTTRPVPFEFDPDVEAANRAWQYYDARMSLAQTRIEIYKEMEEMDDDDIIHSALDAFAEDSTQPDPFTGRTVWVEGENLELLDTIHTWFDDVELEDQIFSITRGMCKYGDDFEQMITAARKGIVAIEWLDPKSVERFQDDEGRIAGWRVHDGEITSTIDQRQTTGGEETQTMANPWDVVHFRLLGGQRQSQRQDYLNQGVAYGQPVVFASRRVWRRFRMMEDSMILYRQRRAPDRDIYYIDCTGLNPGEQWEHSRRWYKEFKKRQYINQAAGDYKTELNPLAHDEDIFLPIVENRNTRIERQAGSANVGDVHDMEFMVNRVFSTLRIPKEYFGFDSEGWDQNKALAQKDIRFARTCKRIQRAVILGITRMIQIHLSLLGIDATLPQNEFEVRMSPISLLDEQGRAELYGVRMDLIDKLIGLGDTVGVDKPKWTYYVVRTFGGFPERVARTMLKNAGGEGGGGGGGEEEEDLGLDMGDEEEGGGDLGLDTGDEEGLDFELESLVRSNPDLKVLAEQFEQLQRKHKGVVFKSSQLRRQPLPPKPGIESSPQ